MMYWPEWSTLKKLAVARAAADRSLAEQTVTGNPAAFTTTAAKKLSGLTIPFSPVQAGSGDPSAANVRTISGIAGTTITRAGKNLFNASPVNGNIDNNGAYTGSSSVRLVTLGFVHLGAGTFTCSNKEGFPFAIYAYTGADEDSYLLDESEIYWNTAPFTFTLTKAKYVRLKWKNTNGTAVSPTDLTEVQIEAGSSATAYEAYAGQAYPVNWTEEAGTVYGGTLDAVTGVLTETHACIASYNGETLPGTWISDRDVYAAGTTPTTGAQVVYELAEARTYRVDPVTVKTLVGANTVLSDTNGTNTIKYLTEA